VEWWISPWNPERVVTGADPKICAHFFEIRLSAPNGSQATSVHWVLQTIMTFNAAKTSSRAALGRYKQSGFF
jgi:hypothetical protein